MSGLVVFDGDNVTLWSWRPSEEGLGPCHSRSRSRERWTIPGAVNSRVPGTWRKEGWRLGAGLQGQSRRVDGGEDGTERTRAQGEGEA